jgi:hypothetical protein
MQLHHIGATTKPKKNPTCDITLAHANSTTLVQNKKSAKSIGIALNHNVCPNMTASAIYRPGYPPPPPKGLENRYSEEKTSLHMQRSEGGRTGALLFVSWRTLRRSREKQVNETVMH